MWEPYGTHKYTLWAENSVRNSHGTHHFSAIKPNRLMLFRETVDVCCENHTEHTNTLCGQRTQSVSHRKHITSPLQRPTGLMLFRETVTVYCENHTDHTDTLCGQNVEFLHVKARFTSTQAMGSIRLIKLINCFIFITFSLSCNWQWVCVLFIRNKINVS
jgi:hypothetical protein